MHSKIIWFEFSVKISKISVYHLINVFIIYETFLFISLYASDKHMYLKFNIESGIWTCSLILIRKIILNSIQHSLMLLKDFMRKHFVNEYFIVIYFLIRFKNAKNVYFLSIYFIILCQKVPKTSWANLLIAGRVLDMPDLQHG